MSEVRGDFKWKNGKVIWVPSKEGQWIIHPVLGPMRPTDPLRDCIIGKELSKEIDKAIKKVLSKEPKMKEYTCKVCGKKFMGSEPISICPSCYI